MESTRMRVATCVGALAALVGTLVLVGWAFDVDALKTVPAETVAMKPNAAFCFVLLGGSLALLAWRCASFGQSGRGGSARLAQAGALLAAMLGVLTLVEYVAGIDLGIDTWLATEREGAVGTTHPTRMAPDTSFCFAILGAALWTISRAPRTRRGLVMTIVAGVLVAMTSLSALLTYVTPGFGQRGWFGMTSMAVPTATLLSLLGIAIATSPWQRGTLVWALGRARTLAFCGALGLLVFIGITSSRGAARMDELSRAVGQTADVIARLSSLRADLGQFELASRGYVGMGSERLSVASRASAGRIAGDLAALRRIEHHDDPQWALMASVEHSVEEATAAWQGAVDLRRTGARDAALQRAQAVDDANHVDRAIKAIDALEASEHEEHDRKGEASSDVRSLTQVVGVSGTLASVLILLGALLGVNASTLRLMRARGALRESNEYLGNLLSHANAPIVVWDPEFRITRFNQAFETMTGRSADEVIGHPLQVLFPPEFAEASNALSREAKSGEHWESVEMPMKHRDGRVRTVVWNSATIVAADGRTPVATIAHGHDITDQRAAEASLRASERSYRHLFDASPQVMWVVDMESERLVQVNDAMVEQYGWSREELLQMTTAQIRPPEEREASRARVHALRADGVTSPGVRRHWRKDGTPIAVEVRTHALEFEGRDCALVLAIDVTERERVQARLLTLSRAVDQSPAAIVITDPVGRIQYVNPQFTVATGFSAAESLGKNPRILKSGTHPPEFYANIWRTVAAGGTWRGEIQNKRKDGTLFWESASISPVTDASGVLTHYVAVKEDISVRKLIEEQLRQAQKMEAVGQLAGGVAHDFNNDLTVISGYSELLATRIPEGDAERAWIDEVRKAAERATFLTQRLLAFGRKQVLRPTPLDIGDVVAGAEKMLRRMVREDVVIRTECIGRLDAVVADAGQVEQVLMNLCVNARDAMPGGGTITIRTENFVMDDAYVSTHAGASPGRYVRLSLTDTGTGMSDEVRSHIFEPFFTTKPAGKGTGLGLAMVYGFVKQSGGYVDCESAPGRGSSFHVFLPVTDGAAGAVAANEPIGAHRGAETILVVDDEPRVGAIVKEILEQVGYTVLLADGPEAAIELARDHAGPIHALLSDLVMPGMSGREVAQIVEGTRPGIAVAFMSGYTDDLVSKDGVLDVGVTLLAKPFSASTLRESVRAVLDAARLGRPGDDSTSA